jgi:hypothetical protein
MFVLFSKKAYNNGMNIRNIFVVMCVAICVTFAGCGNNPNPTPVLVPTPEPIIPPTALTADEFLGLLISPNANFSVTETVTSNTWCALEINKYRAFENLVHIESIFEYDEEDGGGVEYDNEWYVIDFETNTRNIYWYDDDELEISHNKFYTTFLGFANFYLLYHNEPTSSLRYSPLPEFEMVDDLWYTEYEDTSVTKQNVYDITKKHAWFITMKIDGDTAIIEWYYEYTETREKDGVYVTGFTDEFTATYEIVLGGQENLRETMPNEIFA